MLDALPYPDAPADFEDLAHEEFVFGTGTDGEEPTADEIRRAELS